jgi:hypothetical protein
MFMIMMDSERRCIFCREHRPLTSEHIWGDWVTSYVPRTVNKHDHADVQVPKPGEPEPARVRIRAGDPLSSQAKVVCAPCNNGWMSELQNAAKPHLIPLFDGSARVIDGPARTAIAAWAAMATMTGEFLSHDPKKITVSQSDRDALMPTKTASSTWSVWVGNYQRRQWAGSGCIRHSQSSGPTRFPMW